MPHIHTQPGHHDQSVTAYIVRIDTPEPQVLVHMHRKQNVLLPVGGHIELHETPWQAMAHELQEESGYRLEDARILQPAERISSLEDVVLHPYPLSMNTHPIGDDHFHSDISYGFVVSGDPKETAVDGESLDFRWLNYDQLMALDASEIFSNTRQVYDFLLNTALKSWIPVSTDQFSH